MRTYDKIIMIKGYEKIIIRWCLLCYSNACMRFMFSSSITWKIINLILNTYPFNGFFPLKSCWQTLQMFHFAVYVHGMHLQHAWEKFKLRHKLSFVIPLCMHFHLFLNKTQSTVFFIVKIFHKNYTYMWIQQNRTLV